MHSILIDPITWYYSLDKTQTIEFWVAFGTIALAVVTGIAVTISIRQNTAETRRFEQGYAPLVQILPFNVQGNLFNEVSLQNLGYGPALNVELELAGFWRKRHFEELPPPAVGDPPQKVRSERLPFHISGKHAVMMPGDAWGFFIKDQGGPAAIDKDGLETKTAIVEYRDRFGNEYVTRYTDFTNREFEWIRPRQFGGTA